MSNDKFYTKDQIDAFLAEINEKMVMPTIGVGGGFAAVGMLGWYDGYVPPQGWLSCDGTVYDIADYPDLAAHYASQYGSANVFGGDGITTFAVRDLQGEYLRCCGTNSHTGQGDGAGVGEHQDATSTPYTYIDDRSLHAHPVIAYPCGGANKMKPPTDMDKLITTTTKTGSYGALATGTWQAQDAEESYTSRPTTTCFPVCVKASKSDGAWHDYSTEEKEVGTTEDGSKLYEKTITGLSAATTWKQQYEASVTISFATLGLSNIDFVRSATAYGTYQGARFMYPASAIVDGTNITFGVHNAFTISKLTIQYTKTS